VKKRLRKKLSLGEFFKTYIEVRGEFARKLSKIEMDSWMDYHLWYVEKNNLQMYGYTSPDSFFFTLKEFEEEDVIKYLNEFYTNKFVSGQHVVNIHRLRSTETRIYKGWC